MSKIDDARSRVDHADYVILSIVEMLRGLQEPPEASPISVAENINGAPPREVATRMLRLEGLGLLDRRQRAEAPSGFKTFVLSHMGVELLIADLGNWEPARREQERRDQELLSATGGAKP